MEKGVRGLSDMARRRDRKEPRTTASASERVSGPATSPRRLPKRQRPTGQVASFAQPPSPGGQAGAAKVSGGRDGWSAYSLAGARCRARLLTVIADASLWPPTRRHRKKEARGLSDIARRRHRCRPVRPAHRAGTTNLPRGSRAVVELFRHPPPTPQLDTKSPPLMWMNCPVM